MNERAPGSFYKLVDREAVPCSLLEWGMAFADLKARRVAVETVGEWDVSTIFLGIDHRIFGDGPPLIYESMTFDANGRPGPAGGRYATWAAAEEGHALIVAELAVLQQEPTP